MLLKQCHGPTSFLRLDAPKVIWRISLSKSMRSAALLCPTWPDGKAQSYFFFRTNFAFHYKQQNYAMVRYMQLSPAIVYRTATPKEEELRGGLGG